MTTEDRTGTTSQILIRETRPEDIPAVLDIFNALHPKRPPMLLTEHDEHMRSMEDRRHESWVAEHNGAIVGDFDLFEARWYSRPDTFKLFLEVPEVCRHRGIGSRLYETMEQRAGAIGVRRIYTEALETWPESLAFLEHRGWEQTGRADRPSRLTVAEARLDGYVGVEERLRREGIRIATLEEIGTDDSGFLRRVHDMEFRTERDIPSSEPPTQDPFEVWLERQLHGAGKSPATFWIALDGDRPVGVARIRRSSESMAGNGYTGVDPDYRGRGIARALKLKTVEWSREHGIRYLYTENDIENHRMLAINVSLGYQPLPVEIEMVKVLGR
jgi:GNAT superfamily N-acetyltransferase